jgi:hypothetical protein
MSVRDQEPDHDQDEAQAPTREPRAGRRPGTARWGILGHLPALLAASAVVLYGYLAIAYENFYRNLGVDPSDVGLSYTGILARSVGFVVSCLLALLLVFLPILSFIAPEAERQRNPGRVGGIIALAAMLFLLGLVNPLLDASDAAIDVRAGKPAGPIRFAGLLGGVTPGPALVVLAIRGDPATVEPAGKPGDAPAVALLQSRRLLYLGQSSGTAVLYDATGQQAVYLPTGSVILHVSNCTTKRSPDPVCRQLN